MALDPETGAVSLENYVVTDDVGTVLARSANEAMMIATQLGFPVALKIDSPDITHKSDVQGVALNVTSAVQVRDIYNDMNVYAEKLASQVRRLRELHVVLYA